MLKNCGIIAFDKMVGQVNGRTNLISLDTLSKIAQDNKFLLYPMKVPKTDLGRFEFPYILHYSNHFETIEEDTVLNLDNLTDEVYILSVNMVPEYIIEENEAKKVKGGKGAFGVHWKNPLSPQVSNLLTTVGLGMVPVVGPALAAGYGAYQGYTGYGSKGGLMSGLMGGLTGWAGGMGGQGLKAGWQAAAPGLGSKLWGAGSGALFGASPGGKAVSGMLGTGGTPFWKGGELMGINTGGLFGGNTAAGAGSNSPAMSLTSGGIGNAAGQPISGLSALAPTQEAGISGLLNGSVSPAYAGNIANMATTTGAVGTGTTGTTAAGSGGMIGKLLGGGTTQTLAGLGLMGMSAIPQTPTYQPPSEIAQQQSQLSSGKGLTPLAGQTQETLSKILADPYGTTDPYIKSIINQLDQQKELEDAALAQQFQAGGTFNSGDYQVAKANLDKKYSEMKANTVTQANYQMYTNALSSAIGVSQQDAANILGLTGMDANAAAVQYGANVADIQSLRQMISQAGQMVTAGGLGLYNTPSFNLSSLMK